MVILNEKRKSMKYPKSSKLINRLAEMGYVDPNEAAKAVKDYLKTGSLASFAYLVNAKKGKV
jgi:predicted transcriptional regulator YheO